MRKSTVKAERAKMVVCNTEKQCAKLFTASEESDLNELMLILVKTQKHPLPKDKLIGRESFRMNDRIRALALNSEDSRRARMILSRNFHPRLIIDSYSFRLESAENC